MRHDLTSAPYGTFAVTLFATLTVYGGWFLLLPWWRALVVDLLFFFAGGAVFPLGLNWCWREIQRTRKHIRIQRQNPARW